MSDIVNPGDLHGRVLPANEIQLFWDGNQIGALVGPNLVEGVSGWAIQSTRHSATSPIPSSVRLSGSK